MSQDKSSPESGEKWWWPTDIHLLEAEVTEHGLDLWAPEGSNSAEWLAYWSSTPELHQRFTEELTNCLLKAAEEQCPNP